MNAPRAPRLDDVARLAGVSTATVSRFINNPVVVAPATAERIRRAITTTGYVPNLTAGALASSRSRMIAVFVPEIGQSLLNDMVEAMIDELSNAGNSVMLALTGIDNRRLNAEIEMTLARRVDAMVLTGIVSSADIRARLRAQTMTVVETWHLPEDPIDVAIGFSHLDAGRALAEFVRMRGYRRPHLIVPDSPRAEQRAEAFASSWVAGGGSEPTRITLNIPSNFGQGRFGFRAITELENKPDVVICGSDWIAQGIIVEATAAGWRVPDDLAVTGFGNLRMAGAMRPTITSVDVDGARIARETMRVLKARLAGQPVDTRIDVGFQIIARESA